MRYKFTKEDIEKAVEKNRTYRSVDDSLYQTWAGIKARCLRKTHKDYPHYGGAGITICNRWLGKDGYKNFCSDMGEKPGKEYSVDRVDNSKGYTPENCRWATRKQQVLNQKNTIWVEYEGEKMCLHDFSKKVGVSNATLWWRFSKGREVFPGAVLHRGCF